LFQQLRLSNRSGTINYQDTVKACGTGNFLMYNDISLISSLFTIIQPSPFDAIAADGKSIAARLPLPNLENFKRQLKAQRSSSTNGYWRFCLAAIDKMATSTTTTTSGIDSKAEAADTSPLWNYGGFSQEMIDYLNGTYYTNTEYLDIWQGPPRWIPRFVGPWIRLPSHLFFSSSDASASPYSKAGRLNGIYTLLSDQVCQDLKAKVCCYCSSSSRGDDT
jgi:hypothetical protein